MKINLLVSFLTLILVSFLACKNKNASAPHASANPFDTTHFETQSLSETDRANLLKASGKVVTPVSADDLANQINTATGKLHVYCFWNLKTPQSQATVKALNELSAKYDSTKVKITFITMPGFNSMDEINLFIRENQLTDATLILEKADVAFFAKKIRKDMTGVTALPVVLLVNKADDTMLFYNKPMDEKELAAVIAPLL